MLHTTCSSMVSLRKKLIFCLFVSLGLSLGFLGLLHVFPSVRVVGYVLNSLYLLRRFEKKPHPGFSSFLSIRNSSWAIASYFLDSAELFNTDFLSQGMQLPPFWFWFSFSTRPLRKQTLLSGSSEVACSLSDLEEKLEKFWRLQLKKEGRHLGWSQAKNSYNGEGRHDAELPTPTKIQENM